MEGGQLDKLHNGTRYREVRQYRTGHHLVRFYFLTRIYSDYLESILADFQAGPQPDLVIINSCIWDVSRYHPPPPLLGELLETLPAVQGAGTHISGSGATWQGAAPGLCAWPCSRAACSTPWLSHCLSQGSGPQPPLLAL